MKLYELLRKHANERPGAPFLHGPNPAAEADMSYGEAMAWVADLRERLSESGIDSGHRVALALDNQPEFFLTVLALNALDVGFVPLNLDLTASELAFVLEHSGTDIVESLPAHREKLAAACATIESPPMIRCEHDAFSAPKTQRSGANRPTAIVYTSGTTGTPKGCRLSEDYFLYAGTWYQNLGGLCALAQEGERIATPLPTFHVNALVFSFMAALTTGSCLIQFDRFHPKTWWGDVRKSGATVVHYLGVMPAILLEAPEREDDDFSGQIRFGFGAGVEPEHHAAFERRFGFPLVEGWAMTETGAGGCFMITDEPRNVGTRCLGRPPPAQMQWRIVDDRGDDVEPGQPGELLVCAAGSDPRRHFFSGYHRDDEATERIWAGGWLHSGDVVRADREGSLYFVERKKNIIRRSGENIAIGEVEAVLLAHEDIEAAAVTPVPDRTRGEEVFALIVARDHHSTEASDPIELVDFCRARLAYFKVPGYFVWVDDLPTTATQKLRRAAIKRWARDLLESGKAADVRSLKTRQPQPRR